MSDRRYLVMDIETITDWELVRQVFEMPSSATLEELREAVRRKYESGFVPAPYHIPICIALIDVDAETFMVTNAAVLENEEKVLLQQFWKVVRFRRGVSARTTLVHFNGRSFDLPVLFYRSLKHRIPIFNWDRSRYSIDQIRTSTQQPPGRTDLALSHDICDDLADFGASSRMSLNAICKLLGLPGKTDIDGSQIEELYRKGERDRIKDYCMSDTLATYQVWLTVKFTRGEINEENYQKCFQEAEETVHNCRLNTNGYFRST